MRRTLTTLALLLTACITNGGGGGTGTGATPDASADSGAKPAKAPVQACLDLADAVAKAAQRCGQDYQANYTAFVQNAANGNCTNIVAVRDEASLRAVCLPKFATITCADLLAGKIDASCVGQLQHP